MTARKGEASGVKIIKEVKQATYSGGRAEELHSKYLGCSAMGQLQQQERLWGDLWQSQEARQGIANERKVIKIAEQDREVLEFTADEVRAVAASSKIMQLTRMDGYHGT